MAPPPSHLTWMTQDMILELAAWQLARIRLHEEMVFVPEVGMKLPADEPDLGGFGN